MHYLIEVNDENIPTTSLAYQAYTAIKFENWYYSNQENTYSLTKDPTEEADYAVGTLQFTSKFIGKGIRAGFIEKKLEKYAPGGAVFTGTFENMRTVADTLNKNIFCKPLENIEANKFSLELKPNETKLINTVRPDMPWQGTIKDNRNTIGEARILFIKHHTVWNLFLPVTHWGKPDLLACYKFAEQIQLETTIDIQAGALDILWMEDHTPRLMEVSNFISLDIKGADINPSKLLKMIRLGINYERNQKW